MPYIFSNAKDGRLTSFFPIGAALLSAPLYLAFDAQLHATRHPVDITSIDFERLRLHYEKQAANVIAALAAVLLFFSAHRIGGPWQAIVVTVFFVAGTDMWTLGSQALWQHGSVNLTVLALIYALISAVDAPTPKRALGRLFVAGVCAGFLPVIRPTAVIFLIAGAAFAGGARRSSPQAWSAGSPPGSPGTRFSSAHLAADINRCLVATR